MRIDKKRLHTEVTDILSKVIEIRREVNEIEMTTMSPHIYQMTRVYENLIETEINLGYALTKIAEDNEQPPTTKSPAE